MSKAAAARHAALTKNRLSGLRRTSKSRHLHGLETIGEPPIFKRHAACSIESQRTQFPHARSLKPSMHLPNASTHRTSPAG